jgi:hypothetical protein
MADGVGGKGYLVASISSDYADTVDGCWRRRQACGHIQYQQARRIYGSVASGAEASLANTATSGASLINNNGGTAKYGNGDNITSPNDATLTGHN